MDLSGKRGWSAAIELYKYAQEASIECCMDISRSFIYPDQNKTLVIKFIHPTSTDVCMRKALSKLTKSEASRGLTLINEASLVVYIECCVDGECQHRLFFTGDADGNDVVTALTKNKLVDKEFSYVDMPHHGSETNHPKEFLDKIKTKNIGVSTDGSRFHHPSDTTIDDLYDYMKKNNTCHLHLNYKQSKYQEHKGLTELNDRVHYPPDNPNPPPDNPNPPPDGPNPPPDNPNPPPDNPNPPPDNPNPPPDDPNPPPKEDRYIQIELK